MELKTEYSEYNYIIHIDKGIVHRVLCSPIDKNKDSIFEKPEDYFFIQPKDNTEFDLHKRYQPIKAKYKYNYDLKYKNQSDNLVSVPVKLSAFDLLKLRLFHSKKVDMTKEIKKAVISGVIKGVIGLIFLCLGAIKCSN